MYLSVKIFPGLEPGLCRREFAFAVAVEEKIRKPRSLPVREKIRAPHSLSCETILRHSRES